MDRYSARVCTDTFPPSSRGSRTTAGVAAGAYSLLRQLGCATGVAAMTALLQARIQTNYMVIADQRALGDGSPSHLLDLATFSAYTGCFRIMAVITVVIIPGIFLFRVLRPGPAIPRVV